MTSILQIDGRDYRLDSRTWTVTSCDNPTIRFALPEYRGQTIPFDTPQSRYFFQPGADKAFVATPAAVSAYGKVVICGCLMKLQQLAQERDGLGSHQEFTDRKQPAPLWFIDDGAGGAVTALLPDDY